MKIIEKSYNWTQPPGTRLKTDYIVLHHMAGNGSADDIHRSHLASGWSGIGYHFYVRKDGSVYRGRPISAVGAHAKGYNQVSVSVCFEGNFETEKMTDIQIKSGRELMAYLIGIYPYAAIKKHGEFNATACPGRYFPFDEITSPTAPAELTDVGDIVAELARRGIMTNAALWQKKCNADVNAYWLARKIANMTQNATARASHIYSVNDIVWELAHRGIITDKALWLRLFDEDKDLYWLGYKAANLTQ